MIAEIVAIGTELTTGAKLDTNSQWLSLQLAAVGIPVNYHTTVADDQEAMVGVLRSAVNRSDLVLITGGLGPTLDDLTRQAMADLAGVELELHEPSLEFIRQLFARRRRTMPERNVVQAMFPQGSEPLANPRGSAPGVWMEVSRKASPEPCKLAAMPGVPSEMRRMFEHEVLPRLPVGRQVIRRARVNCFGVGESDAEQLLGDLTARGRDPEIGITVHEATITLRITANAESGEECEAKIAEARRQIRQKLGHLVFGEEDDELEHVVVRLLAERKATLATAESGTGGLLAHRLTDVMNLDGVYLGGVVAPTDAAKHQMLAVEESLLREHGPISAAVAEAMAVGCRAHFQSDYALAITECPQFDPDAAGTDAPVAYVALAGEQILRSAELTLLGDPAITKSRAAKAALNLLRLQLIR